MRWWVCNKKNVTCLDEDKWIWYCLCKASCPAINIACINSRAPSSEAKMTRYHRYSMVQMRFPIVQRQKSSYSYCYPGTWRNSAQNGQHFIPKNKALFPHFLEQLLIIFQNLLVYNSSITILRVNKMLKVVNSASNFRLCGSDFHVHFIIMNVCAMASDEAMMLQGHPRHIVLADL